MTRNMLTFAILGLVIGCSSQSDDPRVRRLVANEHVVMISDFPLKANEPKSKAILCTLVGHPGADGRGTYILPVGTRAEVIADGKKTIMAKHTYFNEKNVLVEVGENHDMRKVRVILLDGEDAGRACEIWRYYLMPVDKR